MTSPRIDIGSGHSYEFVCWDPDISLNPQYSGLTPIDRMGAIIYHPDLLQRGVHLCGEEDINVCSGVVYFDTPETQALRARQIELGQPDDDHYWQVESWDPLTISPSVLCTQKQDENGKEIGGCGDHGFVRAGRWVVA